MADEVIVRITGDDADLRRALASADRAIAGLSTKASGLGGALTTALGTAAGVLGAQALSAGLAAIGGGITSAISASASFQSELLNLQAVAGATDSEIARLSQTAKQLGADASIPAASALTAAQAMTELARAGLSVNDVLAASRGTLQLAAAAQVDAATAAEITASALGAFRLQGDQAGRVADVLAASANASASDITEMAYSLRMSSAVAATAGQSLEDTVTALSLLSNAGLRGSDAGTSLKTMLLNLVAPSDSAAKLMQELGISVYDASGNVKPLRDIIETLNNALGKMPVEQRLGVLTDLLGSDAVRAGTILLEAGAEGFDKMSQAINRQGAAAELAAAKTRGAEGALAAIRNAVETAALAFGEPLLRPLQRAGEALAALIAREDVGATLSKMGEVAAGAFDTLLQAGKNVFDWVTANWPAISQTIGAVMTEVGSVLESARPIFDRIVETAGNVVAFIAARWPQIQQVISISFSVIAALAKNVFFPVLSAIVNAAASVVDWVIANWPQIEFVIATVFSAVGSVVSSVLIPILEIARQAFQKVSTFVTENWPLISSAAQVVSQTISDVASVIQTVIAGIVFFVASRFQEMRDDVDEVMSFIRDLVGFTTDNILASVKLFLQMLTLDWQGAFNTLKDMTQAICDSIAGMLRGFISDMAGIGDELIRGLAAGISASAGAVVDAARNAISSAVNAAKSALGIQSPSRVFAAIGVQTIEGFAQGVRSSTPDAGHSVQRAMTTITNNYALNVSPMQSYATLEQDFELMKRR